MSFFSRLRTDRRGATGRPAERARRAAHIAALRDEIVTAATHQAGLPPRL